MWDDEIIKSWCVFDNIRLLHTTSKRESRLKVRSVTTTLKPTTMTILRRQHPRTPPIRYGCDNGRSCETWTIPWSIREPRTWLTWAPWLPGSGGCDGRNLAEPATGVGWFIHWPVLKHGLESDCNYKVGWFFFFRFYLKKKHNKSTNYYYRGIWIIEDFLDWNEDNLQNCENFVDYLHNHQSKTPQ